MPLPLRLFLAAGWLRAGVEKVIDPNWWTGDVFDGFDTDDFFLVLSGRITIRMREGDVELGPGEMFVVPVGVEHQPVAVEEAELLLIEPSGTPNTGDGATAARRVVI